VGAVIDLKRIRQDPEGFRASVARKHEPGADEALARLLVADRDRRTLLAEVERLRAERNAESAEVGRRKQAGAGTDDIGPALERLRATGERLSALERDLAPLDELIDELALAIPNCPDAIVPDGADQAGNVEVRRVGEPARPGGPTSPHWELGTRLGLFDFERAAKISGSRFTVFTGAGARLVRGLVSFMIDLHVDQHGCTEVLPPFVVSTASMRATGQLPKFAADAFPVAEADLWLVPTAEVPVTNLYRGEILQFEVLPIRHVAYTPCWRSEAGAAGRDTRGLIRQHQFDKVEIVHFVAPEDSERHLEEIVQAAEATLSVLALPYRVVEMCCGDLGFAQARKYDLEVWMPSYGRYVEISSCSNYRDFQARRGNIRFRRSPRSAVDFVHTLNGSALAVGRTLAAIVENHQTADGTVVLPTALADVVGCRELTPRAPAAG
jgi:seryl-tRNA synthetase